MGAQSMGAFIVVVLVGFWMARGHLRGVFRKAFYRDDSIDDSDEIVSYRTAVFGIIACSAYLVVWHLATGMAFKYIPIFLFGALVMYLGITRVIAETGLISIRAPLMPQPFAMFVMGSDVLSQQTQVSIALSYSWCSDTKTTIMPALAHSVKLYDTVRGQSAEVDHSHCSGDGGWSSGYICLYNLYGLFEWRCKLRWYFSRRSRAVSLG